MRASARTCVLLWLGLIACDSPREDSVTSTTGGGSTTNDNPNTTIPVTSVSATLTTAGSSSTTDGTDTDASTTFASDTDASTSGTGSSSGSGSGSGSTGVATGSSGSSSSETTDGPEVFAVEWCNLQFPPSIEGDTALVTTAYSRIYIEGLTNLNPTNDPNAQVVVEFGYGADGSLPDAGGWTWVAGTPNAGWDGDSVGEGNNDEYQGDLQFPAAGTYDYAARVSGDGGTSWDYCDLNGLVDGGYTPDQAGAATIE